MFKQKKKFQVIIEHDETDIAVIDSTNKPKEVEEWLDLFKRESKEGSTIKVYECDKRGVYALTVSVTHARETAPAERSIGFGRW